MGLYDDENAGVTGGDAEAEEYWQAKAQGAKLDGALETEQPWDAISGWLPDAINAFEAALKIYPNHRELQSWKEKALSVQSEHKTDKPGTWKSGFPWRQPAFLKGWSSFYRSKWARTQTDWRTVGEQARKARSQWEKCYNVHEWPQEKQKFLEDGLKEAVELSDESFKQLH